jgi:hypothetical protein
VEIQIRQDSYPTSRYLESTIVPTTRPGHFAVLHAISHTTLVYGCMVTDTPRMEFPQVLYQLDTIEHLRDNWSIPKSMAYSKARSPMDLAIGAASVLVSNLFLVTMPEKQTYWA